MHRRRTYTDRHGCIYTNVNKPNGETTHEHVEAFIKTEVTIFSDRQTDRHG